eukprot:TRINITY_DN11115_c0_g1_i2.p3 TRINITY_DN11115_c0_g1~~TRINITY_DN11115_c0_g1_i2.p3  ORF type:complete len:197 (+),score=4.31 TRINITY_DN11115_c0_g1_i2:114-704(+)
MCSAFRLETSAPGCGLARPARGNKRPPPQVPYQYVDTIGLIQTVCVPLHQHHVPHVEQAPTPEEHGRGPLPWRRRPDLPGSSPSSPAARADRSARVPRHSRRTSGGGGAQQLDALGSPASTGQMLRCTTAVADSCSTPCSPTAPCLTAPCSMAPCLTIDPCLLDGCPRNTAQARAVPHDARRAPAGAPCTVTAAAL